ncbi:hypothetical protein F5880DRAFT_1610639 [Lentinula raphanica]|nr:hypothetical protein F5880DRAFT_1610639 [Lentinula raphanica]
MKPLPSSLLDVVLRFQSQLASFTSDEQLLDAVFDLIDSDDDFFDIYFQWIGDNISFDDFPSIHPDHVVVPYFMCDIFACFVRGDNDRAEELLSSFCNMLSDMKNEPSQFNFLAAMMPESPFVSSSSSHSSDDSSSGESSSDDDSSDNDYVDVMSVDDNSSSDPDSVNDNSSSSSMSVDGRSFRSVSSMNVSSSASSVSGSCGGSSLSSSSLDHSLSPDARNKLDRWLEEERLVSLSDPVYLSHYDVTQRWTFALDKVIMQDDKSSASVIPASVVDVIQDMKKLKKNVYASPPFCRAVKESGLVRTIETICDPSFILLHRDVRNLVLEHIHRIGDQLADVLDRWTPSFITNAWPDQPSHFVADESSSRNFINSPKHFVDIFDRHPRNVPGEENLLYCFFLLNFNCFRYSFDRWLGLFLQRLGYNVSNWNDSDRLLLFYNSLMSLLHKWCNDNQHTQDGDTLPTIDVKHFACERWRTIIKKTCWLRKLSKCVSVHAKELTRCKICKSLPSSQHCCQYIYMPHIASGLSPHACASVLDTLRQELRGAGITLVPASDRMEPKPLKDTDNLSGLPNLGTIYHPDSVGVSNPFKLEGLRPDSTIVSRCGHHLLLVLDEEEDFSSLDRFLVQWSTVPSKNVIDFMWWGPFDDDILHLIQDSIVATTGVSAVKRGGQFHSYSGGKMIPLGSRLPSGGRAGDSYTSYSGLEASSQIGLEILFNQAATSVAMQAASIRKIPHSLELE